MTLACSNNLYVFNDLNVIFIKKYRKDIEEDAIFIFYFLLSIYLTYGRIPVSINSYEYKFSNYHIL